MNRRLALVAAASVLGALAAPAIAQTSQYTYTYTPHQAPPGSTISVSVTGCQEHGQPYDTGAASIGGPVDRDDRDWVASEEVPVGPDGSWSVELTIDRTARAGRYTLFLACAAADMVFAVGEEDILILDSNAVPTTTTAPPRSRPVAPPAGPSPAVTAVTASQGTTPPAVTVAPATDTSTSKLASRKPAPTSRRVPMAPVVSAMLAVGLTAAFLIRSTHRRTRPQP